jgi:hypothetical protein
MQATPCGWQRGSRREGGNEIPWDDRLAGFGGLRRAVCSVDLTIETSSAKRAGVMVNISQETPVQTEARLRRVIRDARLTVWDAPYAFVEFPLAVFRDRADPQALALVRDEVVWSMLVPAPDDAAEPFAIWCFHFPAGADNSGFVGWLATHLKARFGTGVFVTCGQNSADGGIFDYWGCPWELRVEVIGAVKDLVKG